MTFKILLVEEARVSTVSLQETLAEKGLDVSVADTPIKAANYLQTAWPDCIVLNLIAGETDGLAYCEALDKIHPKIPRLLVGNDQHVSHLPANGYLPHPFSGSQFTSGLQKAMASQRNRFRRAGDLVLDTLERRVMCNGTSRSLRPKEFELLHELMNHAGEVVSRKALMKAIWETDYLGDTRTLDVHIRWLREKIEQNPSKPIYITTIRGIGYRLDPIGGKSNNRSSKQEE